MSFAGWAIVEIMGHRQRAGLVSEEEVAGARLLRVDIPVRSADLLQAGETVTEYYGGGAIYALRSCAEDVARAYAERLGDVRPVKPAAFRLPAPEHQDAEFDDEAGGSYCDGVD